MTNTCRICGNEADNTSYSVREMQLGMRERFDYFQCGACGCLQIATIPDDLGKYYPANYFSFRDYSRLANSPVRGAFDRWRTRRGLGAGLPRWLDKLVKPLDYVDWLRAAGLGLDARVMDVGCGSGKLLLRMTLGGLAHCLGADPFLDRDITYRNGLTIRKADFREIPGEWDLVMFHHSFEHMADPLAVLRAATEKLSARGALLIRVPLADSEAWVRYRENWYNLDAPRHFFLHTEASMAALARQAGLEIFHRFRDATPAQFAMSELYKRDIPATSGVRPDSILDRATLARFEAETETFNRDGRGDCGGFLLRRSD